MLQAIKNLYKDNSLYFAILITISIAFLSLYNIGQIKPIENIPFIDKVEHFIAYFVLVLSWFFPLQKLSKLKKNKFLVIILVFLYGIVIEILQQGFTSYRQGDLFDVFANLSGIIFGFIVYEKLISHKFK